MTLDLPDDLWLRPLTFAPHALSRIRDRVGWHPDEPALRGQIRMALLEGRASSEQPRWTHGQQGPRGKVKDGLLYAWTRDSRRCWVLQRTGWSIEIVTVLLDRSDLQDHALNLRIRPGMARA